MRNSGVAAGILLGCCAAAIALPLGARAEPAAQPSAVTAGGLDAGRDHTCALIVGGDVRCWGLGFSGQLGYGNTRTIGDNEAPGSAGPVNLGAGRTATALAAGFAHTCAVLDDGNVRCWGYGANGRLGYANLSLTIGDDESPGSLPPVDLGEGHTAKAITAGGGHTCAILEDDTVRCWGFGGSDQRDVGGQLGYGNTQNIGDNETPGSAGAVKLGQDRKAKAITAGANHTCALLDDGNVRCWGEGPSGQLGYGNTDRIGDDETPDTVGPVNLGLGRTATAISAGDGHTCAVLDNGRVRCWGIGADGRLGYGNRENVGDDEEPGSIPAVDLGPGGKAVAISAGGSHTCALLEDRTVRCWGSGASGRLGYASQSSIGGDEPAGAARPVDLGPGLSATAISTGLNHSCARLDDGSVRCWGYGLYGHLGYGNQFNIGDDETPGAAGPVQLKPYVSINSASVTEGDAGVSGLTFTVTLSSASRESVSVDFATSDDTAREPGDYVAQTGRVTFSPGTASQTVAIKGIDDAQDEVSERFLINLANPSGAVIGDGQGIGTIVDDDPPPAVSGVGPAVSGVGPAVSGVGPAAPDARLAAALAAQARRASALRKCLARLGRRSSSGRRRCLRRYGRTPGAVTGLLAQPLGQTAIGLSFNAAGTDGNRPPAAQGYLIKQSRRPIRSARDFTRAQTLCGGSCRFASIQVGGTISLTITGLRPRTTYHYALVARDNVTDRCGPRSKTVHATTADVAPDSGPPHPPPPQLRNRRARSCQSLR